ncbi:cyanophycin synthetase [Pedobacter sp. SYP-B3415]|uniref:cyanophycin synthetase n=1 Tax=Pedobacter sp. SYP-B3415 TaxID=2496641 RepID=UPI00101D6454|nr:cyanophycin synthetase [Pedobacter sp. SYP-B3415]
MKILGIQVLKGPNIWSINRKKLIQMRLDLEELEQRPTNLIEGFAEGIRQLLPGMYSHRCSKGCENGFFMRVDEGTWMGHVIEHIALEIQTLAGMDTGFGRTRQTKTEGVYNVVFSYVEEKAGAFAAEAAVRIAEALIARTPYDLDADIRRLRELREQERLGPSTGSIVDEAIARDIPWIRLNKGSLVQLGYGKNQVRFRATMTERTSSIAVDLAGNKDETKRLLEDAAIPVAKGVTISRAEELEAAISRLGFPLVFKPLDGNHGRGATINVKDEAAAMAAFEHARQHSRRVIVERFIEGYDFRVLVIDNRVVAAAFRDPAHITGDGTSNIAELIQRENEDPRRGYGHENVLTEITVDRDTLDLLAKKDYSLDSIPGKGEKVYLKSTANLSTGGTSVDVTDQVHPQNLFICERISRIIGLDICGIDIMAKNLTQPLTENGGVVLEVNAAPGFRMHLAPSEGLPRNVAAPVLDMLYPPGKLSQIPIIAVTGTNGKTTTTRLISHIIKSNGTRVGFTTSDGIYVQNNMLMKGDTTGPQSAEFILKDPTVEFAVLETARGGILRSGLGFNKCDIGVVTNIQEDHLGISDIHTLQDLARVKSVVIGAVRRKGWAVLNADNPYCVKIARDARCKVAYFSMDEHNPVLKDHFKRGGTAAVFENGYITVKKGDWKIRVDKVSHIPLTFGGSVDFMIQNVLAATLATFLWGYKIEDIRLSLQTFIPSAAQTPGRMNVFKFKEFKVLVDFAHNPDGFNGVRSFLQTVEATEHVGIISGTGDRRDEDIIEIARIAASMFDRVYICQEKYLRGRQRDELVQLLKQGLQEVKPGIPIVVNNSGEDCLKVAMQTAKTGSYLTILSNTIDNSIQRVTEYLDRELGM